MVLQSDFYKIGIIVDDLSEGVAAYREVFDYDWRTIPSAPFPVRIGDEIRTVETRAAVTAEQPRLHLIERIPGTPWEMAEGAAAHHIAYWVDDLQAAAAKIALAGYLLECGDAAEDPAERTWGYFSKAGRMRIELIQPPMPLEQWNAFIETMPSFGS